MPEPERLSLAQRFNLHPATSETAECVVDDSSELEDETTYQAFAVNKQPNQRAEMLDIVFKDGRRKAFSYSHLYRIEYDPQEGIELHFSDHIVRVQGIRLLLGYRRIQSYRVVKIEQADEPTARLLERENTVVTDINISRVMAEPMD